MTPQAKLFHPSSARRWLSFTFWSALLPAALAASGTWTNTQGGSWTNAANWNGGVIAEGAGSTANFTTLTLPADLTVTLDGPRTIGNLNFDDRGAAKHGWTLIPGANGSLTLAGAAPTITTLSATTTVAAAIGGASGLVKRGAGRLELTGTQTHTGVTLVAAGTLGLNGILGNSALTVQSGGRLAGDGLAGGPVTIEAGGALAPGKAGIGTLTIENTLTLAGTVELEVSKSGLSLTSDRVAGLRAVQFGGALTIAKLGAWPLEEGDTFSLFASSNYSGAFASIHPPSLAAGLKWDTANLAVNGSITVVREGAPPRVVRGPQDLAVEEQSAAVFDVLAAGERPFAYQWLKNGVPLSGATAASHALAAVTTNDAASYAVVVTNGFGATTSAPARLTVRPREQPSSVTNQLVVYLNFDGQLEAQAGTTNPGALYAGGAAHGPRYVAGVAGSAAQFANHSSSGQPDDWAVTLGKLDWIYVGDFTVSLWARTTSASDGALAGNKNWASGANVGWVISNMDPNNVNWNAAGGKRRDIDLNPPFADGHWHLVTVTFDRAANRVSIHLDGAVANVSDISPSGAASLGAGLNTLVGASGGGAYSGEAELDEFALWTRALTGEEISGIYAAGLEGRPLTTARPGQPPVITAPPADLTLSAGLDAVFAVGVRESGGLRYQWLFNGAALAGATNATLTLAAVTAASEGVYAVRISNGSGAVISAGALLTVYQPAVTGQWDFDGGDLRATVGADLEYVGDTIEQTTFPYLRIQGRTGRALGFGAYSAGRGLLMRHGGRPNGGGHFVNQYTLLMDLMFPPESSGGWRSLFQSNPFNPAGDPAEFLAGDNAAQPEANGIGATRFYGSLTPGIWHRVAFAVNLAGPPEEQLVCYLDGARVGSQALGELDGRYALGPTAQLLTSGLAGFSRPGYLNSVQFVNACLDGAAIAALGGPAAEGLPSGDAVLRVRSMGRNASELQLSWTGPTGRTTLQRSLSASDPAWADVADFGTNRRVEVPLSEPTAYYRASQFHPDIVVGQLPDGQQSLPTKQILRPAGRRAQFPGRPVDLALSPDGRTAYVKNMTSLVVLDVATWQLLQTLNYPGGGASMHGLAVSPDGAQVYVTGAGNELYVFSVATNRTVSHTRTIALPGGSYPCGLALDAAGARAYVCLSVANTLAVVNLSSGAVLGQIPVGVAPWDVVLSPDGRAAYVSDWGGRHPLPGEETAPSAETAVVVDSRGVAASGVVSFVNLSTGVEVAQVASGLHPSDLALSADGATLYVANANSDTVTVMDTASRTVRESILVRPDPGFPNASAPTGLALSEDGATLCVALGGNNAIAVVELASASHPASRLRGFIPVDWYPGAVAARGGALFVVNVKGLGTREGQPARTKWSMNAYLGTVNQILIPDADTLAKYSAQVFEDGRIPQIRQAQLMLRADQPPVPVPARLGEPSVFKHVLYILKENKTYDQMFGDLPQGNGDPSLCVYPRLVSPNHHALAEQYVLLDNFYCNGVISADGHSWSTEANVTDHLEKAFGGFTRSYTFGDDPLTYSSTGFIWNNVLQHGLTFRNYGEMDYASTSPAATWLQVYQDHTNGAGAIRYVQNIGVASLRPYSSTNVPGWNLDIPDAVRADGFIKELRQAEADGTWADFHFLYLPNDHTGGPPSPRAQVADNDLALGRVVEAVTHSRFGSNTVIFVIEDDPQSGYDHVDAHRSICLVVSPYTKRGRVVSNFYNQSGVLHTMERILGLPPMNQQDAMSPLMFECFTNVPDFTPYAALPNNIPLTEGVGVAKTSTAKERYWARQKQRMDFRGPDRINDDLFNRYIWFTIRGEEPFPARYVGGHGRGLKALGLALTPGLDDDDDD